MKNFILALIAVALIVAIVLAAMGVLTVQNSETKTGIILDKQELKDKTGNFLEKSKEAESDVLEKAGDQLKKAGKDIQEKAATPAPPPQNSPPPADKDRSNREI